MIEFQVIGELKGDQGHLLLLDDDGQCYDYDIVLDEIVPIDVDGSWTVDVIDNASLLMEVPEAMVAS